MSGFERPHPIDLARAQANEFERNRRSLSDVVADKIAPELTQVIAAAFAKELEPLITSMGEAVHRAEDAARRAEAAAARLEALEAAAKADQQQ